MSATPSGLVQESAGQHTSPSASPSKRGRERPKGSVSKDPEANWDIIDGFSSEKLGDYWSENAPVCTAVLRAIGGDTEHDDGDGEVYRPSKIVRELIQIRVRSLLTRH